MLAKLRDIKGGRVTVIDSESTNTFGDHASELHVTIQVHDPVFYREVALGGSIAVGESYRDGHWTCDDLVALIRVFARNMQASSDLGGWGNTLLDIGRKVAHRFNRNTRVGSRRNIAAHYDLSNDFYSLFLDETMTYSSGVFPASGSSLRDASIEKYDRICRKLRLAPSDEVLEIGTGWGGFAEHAVRYYGCRVTTTTISKQQHDFAKQRFGKLGIDDRVSLLMSDYRDLSGEYDKLVSIEMIEAVGHEYYDTFFAKCSSLLKPEGLFALQAITIPDQRYDRYRISVDFIQKYIFPGGCLPSLGALTGAVGRATDFQFAHLEDFALHYARTLQCWRENFHGNLDSIRDLGMTDHFLRLWDYYLCYCEGAFREKQIGVSQILLQKPGNRLEPRYPSLGAIQ
ncbi:Cyclopropane-fatty-acyl-phospholipid synthase [Rubripirellula reticaptiva]|uniref:Cyclopropane-fatty-acyl-phospholipid synthase n=1 Tax=Rubripirellula reticaptiva TaxID=2528013 RepID=A0A5C6F2N5_9BACT|nr:Cyclopropane-fatty-acyl-phospholipid synthase [Rubripirellula reticaptiva]